MEYVDGGSVSLSMSGAYLSKAVCLGLASNLINTGAVSGMSRQQIACEIFAHAVIYYGTSPIVVGAIGSVMFNDIRSHANPIDIADGGDTWKRRVAFNVIWALLY
ncbi:hypothetical protein [Clostridium vincentii]|uniref:Uncharacterized protein n=1 Tax=Clostridium vincentii TaxID=52704 RepID=A0A2T0BI10_9CLOT|nr:hypothetical protein [Clostridium vincentii]PRR83477.1 hypothetical protein CLVI_10260 [Clostridium vincentii]